jgi:maleylacetate reductase
MRTFTYTALPWRVLFGRGAVGAVSQEVLRLGASRVLMVTGPDPKNRFSAVADALGALVVARFDGATMHTPTDITARALKVAKANAVDCIVSVGGGSSTGLSKALAVRADYVQVVVPTTYAGSEVTPVLGETEGGVKTTRSSPDILPETVVYDPDLTLGLPTDITLTSAVNAMAHAVEAMYSAESNPVIDGMALQAIRGITGALPIVIGDSGDRDGRAELLQSAWLAGMCMASVPMGLHHKLYDLVATLGGPTSLQELRFRRDDVQRAAELATSQPYPNPRAVTRGAIVELLGEALAGRRPVDGV